MARHVMWPLARTFGGVFRFGQLDDLTQPRPLDAPRVAAQSFPGPPRHLRARPQPPVWRGPRFARAVSSSCRCASESSGSRPLLARRSPRFPGPWASYRRTSQRTQSVPYPAFPSPTPSARSPEGGPLPPGLQHRGTARTAPSPRGGPPPPAAALSSCPCLRAPTRIPSAIPIKRKPYESARRLAALGGTEPKLGGPRRRRTEESS